MRMRLLAAIGLLLGGLVASGGFLFAVGGSLLEPLDAAIAVVHLAPFVVAALFAISWSNVSRASIALCWTCPLVMALFMMWADSIADSDAQGGLVYLFFTPLCAAGIAVAYALVGWLISRGSGRKSPTLS